MMRIIGLQTNKLSRQYTQLVKMSSSQLGDLGSGAGQGGGAGGAIRSAGGAFGKLEAAQEESYFHKKQLQQLRDIKAVQQQETDEAAKPKQQSPTEKKTST